MIKRGVVLLLAVGFAMVCRPAGAQIGNSPLEWNGSLDSAMALSTFYGNSTPVSSAIGQMGTLSQDLFPLALLTPVPSPRSNASGASDPSKDSTGEVAPVQADRYYYGGEMGVFYGHSSGKFGGSEFGSYVVGTVGTDKLQITAGASYDEFDGHFSRHSH